MNRRIIRNKIRRIRNGEVPRALDLFAGCGGISLGFQSTGFEIAGAVEFDEPAAASHGLNFHPGDTAHAVARDITTTSPGDLTGDLGLGRPEEAFDILVGGPPCQAFARVGRSKLREIDDHPEAFIHDPRSRLYLQYLRYVEVCHPLAVLVENVPDVLNHGGQNIAEEICEVLESKGYVCAYTLLNSAFYGVPQMRERMFLLAYRREIADQVTFPTPTHWVDLPPGYEGSRAVALKLLNSSHLFENSHHYVSPPVADNNLDQAVTAREAIGDLPPIHARRLLREGRLRRGTRRLDEFIPYDDTRLLSDYADTMRTWPGFQPQGGICDHVIRYLPRDYALFARMRAGDQYPEAYEHALRMLDEAIARSGNNGDRIQVGSDEYEALKASIVPPYDPGKFPNKWRKMWPDKPARTLMAHLGKDGYSHIHYDSRQARTISVREAARLQSFPDGFRFCGTMNPAFRQIGNAVPPLMARALAEEMLIVLNEGQE